MKSALHVDELSRLIDENQGTDTQEQEDADKISVSLLAARDDINPGNNKRKKSFGDIQPSFMFLDHAIVAPLLMLAACVISCFDDHNKKRWSTIIGTSAGLESFGVIDKTSKNLQDVKDSVKHLVTATIELNKKVDVKFDELDVKFDELNKKVGEQNDELNKKFDELNDKLNKNFDALVKLLKPSGDSSSVSK
uniref:Uncharacterized protein n=1 Tax=Attheya septentrionalis TaxID=420275 RepID=A0A7S2UMM5_9STRA|mmetsp:Transcript_29490/g.54044  ORF Transcript_29490/g.54044 Transcript_29490/m.54044 type:complete len:193 (+) Transcript_29490:373-951(+)